VDTAKTAAVSKVITAPGREWEGIFKPEVSWAFEILF
jgi:hypothetical protein